MEKIKIPKYKNIFQKKNYEKNEKKMENPFHKT